MLAATPIETVLWSLLALGILVPAILTFHAWTVRTSERLAREWAGRGGLKIVLLERRRFGSIRPALVSEGRNWIAYHFVARDAAGTTIDGWVSVGSTPTSIRPNVLRIVVDGQFHEERV